MLAATNQTPPQPPPGARHLARSLRLVTSNNACAIAVPASNLFALRYMSTAEYAEVHGDPLALVEEVETAWGLQLQPGYNPDLSYMSHLWQPLRCHYRYGHAVC